MAQLTEHLTAESLEKYFQLGAISVFNLSETVGARLEIEPASEQLRLFVPAKGGLPEVNDFERIHVDRVEAPGAASRYRLVFDAREMHFQAYQLVESIVSSLRAGFSFRHAVSESIAALQELLASRSHLSDDEQIGLWGELLVLEHLIEKIGEDQAIGAWLGPSGAEHDFSLNIFEVEVKTTRSETRKHWIGSDSQLDPSPERPLYLVSIQATLAGTADGGRTLPQLVAAVRSKLHESAGQFEAALSASGFRDLDADLYFTDFQLRATPRAYLVDGSFPSLTRARLAPLVPSYSLISELRYRIDVSALPNVFIPYPLQEFCEEPK